jgi:hypothetical protein
MTALGLLLALGSALALNWGFFVQHGAAGSLPPLSLRRPARSLRLLFANPRWLVGFLVGLGGWALYVGALRLAPLSLVQGVAAGGLGILALLVWLSPGAARPGRREQAAVAVSVLGLVLLAVSLAGQGHTALTPSSGQVAVWLVGLAVAGGVTAASTRIGLPAAVALGASAGIFYATGDVATKAAVASLGLLFVPVVLASHGLAFVSLQLAFQRGGALVTVGLATLLTNALPIAAGAELFHEGIPPGPLGAVRLAAFALVVAGAALLGVGVPDEPALSSPAHAAGATTTLGFSAGRSSNERLPSPL